MTSLENSDGGKCWELVKCRKCGYEFPAPAIRADNLTYLLVDCVNYCPKCGANLHKLWEVGYCGTESK